MLGFSLKKTFYSQQICEDDNEKKYEEKEGFTKEEGEVTTKQAILSLIGSNIRAVRKVKKHTISELANNAGISAKYLQGVEVGKRNISITNLNKIANVLEIPLSNFFRDVDSEKSTKLFLISSKLKNYSHQQLEHIEALIKDFENMMRDDNSN